jgi:hypothetical protein
MIDFWIAAMKFFVRLEILARALRNGCHTRLVIRVVMKAEAERNAA